MKVISKEQWETTPKDFKGFIDGEPHLVYLDLETQGTVYGPVKIVDKFLGEYCWNEMTKDASGATHYHYK